MNDEEAQTFRVDNAGTTSSYEAEAATEIIVAQGFAEMDQEHQDWYEKAARERNKLAEAAADDMDMGDETWAWGASLRSTWASAQQVDKSLAKYFRRQPEFNENPLMTYVERRTECWRS